MADAEENKMFNARMVIIGLTAALITVGALAGYLFINADEASDPVILRADASPYKVKPADRGGKKLDNLDSPMMERLAGVDVDAGTEILVPPEEEPELPPITVVPEPVEEGAAVPAEEDTQDVKPVEVPSPEEETPAVVETAEAEPAEVSPPQKDVAANPEPEPEPAPETPSQNDAATPAEPEPTVVASAPSEPQASVENIDDAVDAVTQPEANRKTVTASGENNFLVQFAAFRSEKSARETAALLTTKHTNRLDGMILGYMRKAEYWRVVSDPMPREDAAALCRIFVSVGQDCIVKSLD